MNTKVLLVAFAIVAVGSGIAVAAPARAQDNMSTTTDENMTSMGDNMTMMGDNMTGTTMGNTTAGG
jgi:pentapeptide MXKDX repeat protein